VASSFQRLVLGKMDLHWRDSNLPIFCTHYSKSKKNFISMVEFLDYLIGITIFEKCELNRSYEYGITATCSALINYCTNCCTEYRFESVGIPAQESKFDMQVSTVVVQAGVGRRNSYCTA